MYRPLPDGLTIKNSPIEGLGLFTNVDIKKIHLLVLLILEMNSLKINISELHLEDFIIIQMTQL